MATNSLEALKEAAQRAKLAADQAGESLQEFASSAGQVAHQSQIWDKSLVISLGLMILVFGLAAMGMMLWLVAKRNADLGSLMRAFSLPIIIVSAIFLVVVGYDRDQITPVIGLLGTIAGYLLGSRREAEPLGQPKEPETPERTPPKGT